MSFEFRALSHPFPRWFGPYSPARGTTSGLRIQGGVLGTYVTTPTGQQRWVAHQCAGVQQLQTLVVSRWGGGRVLLMPNGWVIKPDPTGNGIRWAIGRFSGPLILQRGDGTFFNMASPGALTPGMHWPGPSTTGVQCILDAMGSLRAQVIQPNDYGEDITDVDLISNDPWLAFGLRAARPGVGAASVRVTENGHVITMRQDAGGWTSVYVGFIDPSRWPHDEEWVESAVPQPPRAATGQGHPSTGNAQSTPTPAEIEQQIRDFFEKFKTSPQKPAEPQQAEVGSDRGGTSDEDADDLEQQETVDGEYGTDDEYDYEFDDTVHDDRDEVAPLSSSGGVSEVASASSLTSTSVLPQAQQSDNPPSLVSRIWTKVVRCLGGT